MNLDLHMKKVFFIFNNERTLKNKIERFFWQWIL